MTLLLATNAAAIVFFATFVGVSRVEALNVSDLVAEKAAAIPDAKCGGITYIPKMSTRSYPRATIPPPKFVRDDR